jgi:hypothetical protein
MEATPHLRFAVQLGVRLVAGLAFLKSTQKWDLSSSSLEKRMAHWCRLDLECQQKGKQSSSLSTSSWILESFQLGPNHSKYNLEHILKCPVFPEESGNSLTLYSHPEVSLKQQILQAQKTGLDVDEEFPLPLADQVDDESWMVLQEGGGDGGSTEINNDLDGMLSRFQNFMAQPSDVQGVESSSTTKSREIRPRVFMNILLAVLKDEALSFPSNTDPFFYQEDYDLMDDTAQEDDDQEESETVQEMKGLMVRARHVISHVVVLRASLGSFANSCLCSCVSILHRLQWTMNSGGRRRRESLTRLASNEAPILKMRRLRKVHTS